MRTVYMGVAVFSPVLVGMLASAYELPFPAVFTMNFLAFCGGWCACHLSFTGSLDGDP